MVSTTLNRAVPAIATPARGEVWLADLAPTRGREQSGRRPVLVFSSNYFNQGPTELVVTLPMTATIRPTRWHVLVQPPEGGLKQPTDVMCENLRAIAKERFVEKWGRLQTATIERIEDTVRILLGL